MNNEDIFKKHSHNPPHLFRGNAKYFITSSTLGKFHYLKAEETKFAIQTYLFKSFDNFDWKVEDWVILNNHYHVLADSPENALSLERVMNNFHRFSSIYLSKNGVELQKEKYFHNYWDTCVADEESYSYMVNYIWYNPVKHGYIDRAEDWKFGSFFDKNKEEELNSELLMQNDSKRKVKIIDDF